MTSEAVSHKKSANTGTKSASTHKGKKLHVDKTKIAFVAFVSAWVVLSFTASQIIVAYPMRALLGEAVTKPLWTLVYSILQYSLTLLLVIWLPPRVWRQSVARHSGTKLSNHKPSKPKFSSDQPGQAAAKVTAPRAATASISQAKTLTKNNPLATSRNEMGMGEFPTFVDIGLAPIGYVAYIILANVLITAMSVFQWFDAGQAQDVGFGYFITTGDRIMAMIALVLIAPVVEEIIMRGWLYGKLRTKLSAISATLLVSILFGLLHGQWNVAITTFALSIVMCSLREITGTIWSGILLHMLSNGIAFYLLYIAI